jgi:hypothetical protein
MKTQSSSILGETIAAIRGILGSELDEIEIERVVVGLFFTGVKLSNGAAGTSATPIKSIPEAVCCPTSTMAMPFPGKMQGRRAAEVAEQAFSEHGIRRAVGIATVNALADCCWQRRPHPDVELHHDLDAFDATDIRTGDTVVVVGAFVPFLKCYIGRRGYREGPWGFLIALCAALYPILSYLKARLEPRSDPAPPLLPPQPSSKPSAARTPERVAD